MQIPAAPKVILRHCAEYDPDTIRAIIESGLEELDLRPHGRTLIKPNIVAAGPMFPHAYTRPEFAEGVIAALKSRALPNSLTELAVGERCGITVPSRAAFELSGYDAMIARHPEVKRYLFDEVPQVEIRYTHKERLRDYVFTPEPIAKADFFVNLPKFKAHPWTTVTFSLKSYIGIQDDRHRLIDHDHTLDQKVADLQYIIQPQFIAIDAITAGEGRMLTPVPFDMGLVICGDNQVAVDSVCCRLIGLDPLSVAHIRMAHERGFGPVDLDEITLGGDVDLAEAKRRGTGFRVGLIRVEDYFRGTNIRAYGGPPPTDGRVDYCWGGCPGALEEAIELLRLWEPAASEKVPVTHVVFGKWERPLEVGPGERVIFIGDCAEYRGPIGERQVAIESLYRDRSTKHPLEAEHDDIFAKVAAVGVKMRKARWRAWRGQDSVVRIAGCPVSVAEQVLTLVELGKLPNPYLDPQLAIPFVSAYLSWRTRAALQRVLGQPYNQPGPLARGEARPHQNLPPVGVPTPLEFRARAQLGE